MRHAKLKPGQVPNKRLHRARYLKGWSQDELAEKVTAILGRKTTGKAISNIETGVVVEPRIGMKRAIAEALNVPIEKLFPYVDDEDGSGKVTFALEDRGVPAA